MAFQYFEKDKIDICPLLKSGLGGRFGLPTIIDSRRSRDYKYRLTDQVEFVGGTIARKVYEKREITPSLHIRQTLGD